MPVAASEKPLVLIAGDDDFAVKQRARKCYEEWCAECGGFDHEIIPASASNSGEALKIIARFREAMQTLPFFGGAKVIWLQNCNFLGEERAASSAAVTETCNEIADEFKAFDFSGVRILISAGKVDKRRAFYKTIDKLGRVENFEGWSAEDRDWADLAESEASKQIRAGGKSIADEALGKLVANVGPNRRALHSEIEKLLLYTGDRAHISAKDVDAIVTRNKQARAFALADALGERDLKAVLQALDDELWEMKTDSARSEIGLLYGLISKVRAMIFTKEMSRQGWVDPRSEYNRFKTQVGKAPAAAFPQDKRFNPLAMNAYVLYRALLHSANYTEAELVRAMELLLQCNQKLIFSSLDETLVLQQTLVDIVGSKARGRSRS
jgi:DNA polymerase III subunit delta